MADHLFHRIFTIFLGLDTMIVSFVTKLESYSSNAHVLVTCLFNGLLLAQNAYHISLIAVPATHQGSLIDFR